MMSEEEKVLTAIDFVRDIEQLEEEAAEVLNIIIHDKYVDI